MKSLMLSLGTLFLMVVSLEFAAAQTTSTTNATECAKMCAKTTANCNPADCAKICPIKPNCNPADCQKVCASNPNCKMESGTKTASVTPVAASIEAVLTTMSNKPKSSCCSKAASASTTSCASEAKATKIASNN